MVPDPIVLREAAATLGVEFPGCDWEKLCSNPKLRECVLKEMNDKGTVNKLNKLEQVSTYCCLVKVGTMVAVSVFRNL